VRVFFSSFDSFHGFPKDSHFAVRVFFSHGFRGVASQLHAEFLADAGICHTGNESVPEAVKGFGRKAPALAFPLLLFGASVQSCLPHDVEKLTG
jgi:hypothetical protein